MSSSRTRRFLELTFLTAAFVAAAVVMTLPLWRHPTRTLPSDGSDTVLATWIVAWDADRFRHALRGVWNAPIFFPYQNTLAFAENLLGIAALVAPVFWITQNAVLTYNTAFVLSFAIAGIGMYLLVDALTGCRPAAVAAGAFYAFSPFRMAQVSHIQMVATGWLPVTLYALHRYFATRRPRWLALVVAGYELQLTSNLYVGYFLALPVAFVAVDGVIADSAQRGKRLLQLGLAGLALGAIAAPLGMAYYRARVDYGQVRGSAEIDAGSADVRSYVVMKDSIGIWRYLPSAVQTDPEKELFPGVLPVVLAGVAALHAIRRRDAARRWVRLYLAILLAAFVLSLGPTIRIWGHPVTTAGPYAWMLRFVPGANGMRVPARFAIVVIAALSVLAGLGAAVVLARAGRRIGQVVAAGFVLFCLAEGWFVPMTTVGYAPRGRLEDRAAAEWLAERGPGAVLHLPLATGNVHELDYQYATLFHRHPIVNGYGGYVSGLQALFRDRSGPLFDWPRSAAAVRMLRAAGIRYVIVHPGDYDAASQAAGDDEQIVAAIRASGQTVGDKPLFGAVAFELAPWTDAPAPPAGERVAAADVALAVPVNGDRAAFLADGDPDTRWFAEQDGGAWIDAAFRRPVDVARVELQMAGRSLTDYPRQLTIDSTDPEGRTRTLYDAPPYPEFLAAFLRDASYPRLQIDLPGNRSARLRIRDTAIFRRWWSVHEIRFWARRPR